MRLVLRAGRRALWRHPVQLVLAVTGVAIGVAVVVSVNLANQSARTAMRLAVEAVAGKATHQIVAGPEGLPEALYTRLRTQLGIDRVAPVVEGGAVLPDAGDQPVTLLGLDAFAEAPFRGYLTVGGVGDEGIIAALLTMPDRVVLPRSEARRLGVGVGDLLTLRIDGRRHELTIVALAQTDRHDLTGLVFADIAVAQQLLGKSGRLDRIDLMLPSPAAVEAVRDALPAGAALVPAAARANALVQMSDAFHLNLTALSLLALVVGLFLVFNTLSFLVVRRRALVGTLRALGATRTQVLTQTLADAALVGAIGTAIGLILGVALATVLVDLVLQTVQDVYFERALGGLRISAGALLPGLLLGLGGTLLAALAPAREAATVAPRAALARSDLEARSRRGVRVAALLGLVALVVGALALMSSRALVMGFAGLFAIILGFALVTPLVTARLGHHLARRLRHRLTARLAVNGAVVSLSRTGVAVAALTVAVAAVIGVAVMIDSFRASVIDWLEHSLSADFYVDTPGFLPDTVAERLAALPGVDYVTRSRWYRQPTAEGYLQIWALGLPPDTPPAVELLERMPDALDRWRTGTSVLVSEPLAWKRELTVGDRLPLRTDRGERTFTVAGLFRDYGAAGGVVLIRLEQFRALWGDARLTGIGVHTNSGDPGQRERIAAALTGQPGARVRDNRAIFERSLEVFDRTFLITGVLRLLAALVAFVGVLGALMALQLDRAREYATLRALGLGRGALGRLITVQSGLLGLASGALAIPLGLLLAWLLVFVINRRAFGWTMDFAVRAGPLLEGVALAVVAASLAAIYPAWRTARAVPARGLREE